MPVTIVDDSNPLIVEINEDIEISNIKAFRDSMLKIVENCESDMAIDFSKIEYIDSSGVGILISVTKELKKKNKKIHLTNLPERISKILELSSLNDLISGDKNSW
ncbi:STAS domain-containing protein [Spirochaetota bacterium]